MLSHWILCHWKSLWTPYEIHQFQITDMSKLKISKEVVVSVMSFPNFSMSTTVECQQQVFVGQTWMVLMSFHARHSHPGKCRWSFASAAHRLPLKLQSERPWLCPLWIAYGSFLTLATVLQRNKRFPVPLQVHRRTSFPTYHSASCMLSWCF